MIENRKFLKVEKNFLNLDIQFLFLSLAEIFSQFFQIFQVSFAVVDCTRQNQNCDFYFLVSGSLQCF